jgi:hypothetical protein
VTEEPGGEIRLVFFVGEPAVVREKTFGVEIGMVWVRLVLFLVLAVCLAPLASVFIASGVANWYGCGLDEGNPHPCVIGGVDYGHDLYTMAMMGWIAIGTVPIAGMIAMVWVVVELQRGISRRRSASVSSPEKDVKSDS